MKLLRRWWLAAFIVSVGAFSTHAAIVEEIAEVIPSVEGHISLQLVEKPVRDGKFAFKHVVGGNVRTSEIVGRESQKGGEYWYGWSLHVPEEFDTKGKRVTWLGSPPVRVTAQNGNFPVSRRILSCVSTRKAVLFFICTTPASQESRMLAMSSSWRMK